MRSAGEPTRTRAEFDLSEDVALVTGGSGALGSAVVDAFAAAGASVAVTDVVPPDEGAQGDPDADFAFYRGDLTGEA